MKTRKIFINLLIIMVLSFAPLGVNAANYDSCIEKFGTIKLESTGGDNNIGGNIDYTDPKNNNKWSSDPVTFKVNVQAPTNHKVKKIYYKIHSFGDDTCSGFITGTDIENNTGNVKLSVVINKGYVEKISFGGTSVNRKKADKLGSITVEDMNIKREETEGEYSENNSSLDNLIAENEEMCDDNLKELISKYWKWIVFLVPFALLIFISVDFMKAMTSGEADSIKKSGNSALKRVIAALILLLLPTIIKIVFTWFGIENYLCF